MQLISKPFGGYRNILEIDDIHFDDAFLTHEQKEFLKVSDREKQLGMKFGLFANNLGMKNTRWGRLTIILFGLWAMFTAFVCFEKPDFLNLTIAILGLFIFLDPQQMKQSYLRMLVYIMPLSWLYDGLWLYEKTSEYWGDTEDQGVN